MTCNGIEEEQKQRSESETSGGDVTVTLMDGMAQASETQSVGLCCAARRFRKGKGTRLSLSRLSSLDQMQLRTRLSLEIALSASSRSTRHKTPHTPPWLPSQTTSSSHMSVMGYMFSYYTHSASAKAEQK